MNKILFIEICNYDDFPIGGYLSFAKQMLTAFGNQLSLVGMSTDDTPVGKWVKKDINGISYDYFSVRKVKKSSKKSWIPARLISYFAVRKYKKQIFSLGIDNVFVQTPEVLFAIKGCKIKNLCTRIPGIENPLSLSRYWYGKYFAKIFDFFFFKELKKINVILASADKNAITGFLKRGKNILNEKKVIQFPTRINRDIFSPSSKINARNKLKIDTSKIIIATTGRLSTLKGWEFMLEAFIEFKKKFPESLFVFLGDGEDRQKIEDFIKTNNIKESVILAGRLSHYDLSLYLNAADIYVMGSYAEGWATSLVEAIACAKPIVCTNFSSADELVNNDYNGFIIESHNISLFTDSMIKCFDIPKENLLLKSNEMQKYASSNLKNSILGNWKLL